ncbi:hypothetical protein ACFWFI_25480 [Streptomyces sp. NPDC060209]|uniref:hypothetical protein n=1 Tax=Streptomyces sp. NPDC060209 TaxID=3347073 RepID=UPI0036607FA2
MAVSGKDFKGLGRGDQQLRDLKVPLRHRQHGTQLGIRDVDVHATVLTASIRIRFIDVGTSRICIGADIIPADLPAAIQLPRLTARPAEAGQVLVDAQDVRRTGLTAGPRIRTAVSTEEVAPWAATADCARSAGWIPPATAPRYSS